jgi:hypothetical protein
MVKCPYCEKEIKYLRVQTIDSGTFSINEGYEWVSDVYGMDYLEIEYLCPECLVVLFKEHSEAENFLRGGQK